MTAEWELTIQKAPQIVDKRQGGEFNCTRECLQRLSFSQLSHPRPILAPGPRAYPWPPLLPASSWEGTATHEAEETGRRDWACGSASSGLSSSSSWICLSATRVFWAVPRHTLRAVTLGDTVPHYPAGLQALGSGQGPANPLGHKLEAHVSDRFPVTADGWTSNFSLPRRGLVLN